MNPISELTRKLGESEPEWTAASLEGGARNPLVLSGILVYDHLRTVYTCTDCDADCPGELAYFSRPRTEGEAPSFAAHCLRDGHLIAVDAAALQVWHYDPQRLAELVRDAFDCETCRRSSSGRLYQLGLSRTPLGKHARQICLLDRLDDPADPVLKREGPQNESYLLLVGRLTCDLDDVQLRRRVFTFEDVLRLQPDGSLEIVFDLIATQLDEKLPGGDPPPPRGDRLKTEQAIARYILEVASQMLGADATERARLRKEALSFEAIGKAVGISKSKISENYLGRACMNADKRLPHRLFYYLCEDPQLFTLFEEYAHSLRTPILRKDPKDVHMVLLAASLSLAHQKPN